MEHDTPVPNAVNTVDDGRGNNAKPINVRREIVTDEQGDRRWRQPGRRAVPGTVRERGQPARTARGQLAGHVVSENRVAGNGTTQAVGPGRLHGQDGVGHPGDARPGELHQRQREPPVPGGTRQVGITSLAAEHVRGIGTDGADTVAGDGTHYLTFWMETTTSSIDTATERSCRLTRRPGRTTPSATRCRRARSTEPPPAGRVAMS